MLADGQRQGGPGMPQILQPDHRQPCARGFDGERPAELKAGYPLPLPEPYDQPVFTRVKVVHRDYHVEVARPLYSVPELCSARAWTPASTASAGHFLVSRRPHVTRRAMISRTQVRSARPPCVC